jgi:hypothetical protein
MEDNNGSSRVGWILAILVIIAFAAWMLGDVAAQATGGW